MTDKPLKAPLGATQQQGGEQEAREFLARCKVPGKDYLYCIKPSELESFTAALRTKQPAASECDCIASRALHEKTCASLSAPNTSKRAAGEVVTTDECGRPLTYWGGKAPPRRPADDGNK